MIRAIFRRLRSSLVRPLLPLTVTLLGRRSWEQAQRLGAGLGSVYWRLGGRDRRRSLEHLRIAFPDASDQEIENIASRCFRHLTTSLTEYLHLLRQAPERTADHLDIEGWEHVAAAQDTSRGVLVITGHCGNWELLGPAFRSRSVQLSAIVRGFEEGWVNDAVSKFRSQLGTEVIRRGEPGSARQLLSIFRGQGNLLVLIDHDIRTASAWVPFFGKLAHTAIGPAQMALRHSLIVIPAFCERQDNGRHIVRFHPPLDLPNDETEATAMMTRTIEEQIRRVPAQWTWMHRRWRRRPEGEEKALRS
jgi:KDO2-lipid IV(A) lauroyltransferase